MLSVFNRAISRGRCMSTHPVSCVVASFHSSNSLLKDKNDNRSSGLAAPRKTVTKVEAPKKEKTQDDKEKRKQEKLEREKHKEKVRLEQLARSKERKEKEAMLHNKKIEKVTQSVAQAKFVEFKITEAEIAADKNAEESLADQARRKRKEAADALANKA